MGELSEKFIEKQDWFCYYGVMTLDKSIGIMDNCIEEESIRYADILEKMSQDESVLQKLSIKNLMHVLSCYRITDENRQKVIQIISERIDNEPFQAEDLMKDVFLKPIFYGNFEFSKLPKELGDKIKEAVLERGKALQGTNCEKFASKFETVSDYSSFLACFESGELSAEKVAIIENALNSNQQALRHVNFSIFKDSIYNALGSEFISYAMKFPNLSTQLDIFSKANPALLGIIGNKIREFPRINDGRNLIDNLVQYCTNNCYRINAEEVQNQSDLVEAALRNNKSKRDNGVISVPFSANYRKDLEEAIDEEYRKIMENGNEKLDASYKGKHFELQGAHTKLDVIKNIYFNKYFAMSLKEAESLIETYGQNIENMKCEKGRNLLSQIKTILELEDKSQMDFSKNMYADDGKMAGIGAEELEEVKQLMEREYALSYTDELQQTQENIENEENRRTISFGDKQITQIEASGDFSLLVHSTEAGFVNESNVSNQDSYKKKWSNNDKQFNHVISMSYINQDFLGMAPVERSGVMYGFSKVSEDSIRLMGDTDINTFSNEFGYNASAKKYLTADAMPYNSRRVYNEFGIERSKTMPDYVLLFDDSTEENIQSAYKAASDWDIPVLFFNKEKISERQIENLESLRKQFDQTKDPEKLKALLNTYETNMAGWLLNRKQGEEDKSHTGTIDNERFREKFDQEYQRITKTLEDYLSNVSSKRLEANDNDLIRIMQIVLEERDLYAKCEKTKPISKTAITIDTESILRKLNDTMKDIGIDDFSIDLENIPTALEYKKGVTMKKIMQSALLEKGITMQEVREAEKVLSNENVKEEGKEEYD